MVGVVEGADQAAERPGAARDQADRVPADVAVAIGVHRQHRRVGHAREPGLEARPVVTPRQLRQTHAAERGVERGPAQEQGVVAAAPQHATDGAAARDVRHRRGAADLDRRRGGGERLPGAGDLDRGGVAIDRAPCEVLVVGHEPDHPPRAVAVAADHDAGRAGEVRADHREAVVGGEPTQEVVARVDVAHVRIGREHGRARRRVRAGDRDRVGAEVGRVEAEVREAGQAGRDHRGDLVGPRAGVGAWERIAQRAVVRDRGEQLRGAGRAEVPGAQRVQQLELPRRVDEVLELRDRVDVVGGERSRSTAQERELERQRAGLGQRAVHPVDVGRDVPRLDGAGVPLALAHRERAQIEIALEAIGRYRRRAEPRGQRAVDDATGQLELPQPGLAHRVALGVERAGLGGRGDLEQRWVGLVDAGPAVRGRQRRAHQPAATVAR